MNERQRNKKPISISAAQICRIAVQCSHSVAWCHRRLMGQKKLAQKQRAQALMELIVQKALIATFPAVLTHSQPRRRFTQDCSALAALYTHHTMTSRRSM